jgi:hypothetical protein
MRRPIVMTAGLVAIATPFSGAVRGPEEFAAMLATAGLDPAQRVVTYCGGGHYGALKEWTSDASNPVESVP